MKNLTKKGSMQKIIILIVIVLSFNFIAPTYSQASIGGVLMGPIVDFLAGIGDVVMSALQFFMYDGNITMSGTAGAAGSAALTIINPFDSFLLERKKGQEDEFDAKLAEYDADVTQEELDANLEKMRQDGLNDGLTEEEIEEKINETGGADITISADNFDVGWIGSILPFGWGDKAYGIPIIKYTPEAIFSNQIPALDVNFINPRDWTDIKDENGNQKYPNADLMNERSITRDLHSTIANWYVALRNLAIVALLSVLLYVGIRIVISSTAADKSKYKEMLMDWVIALCILFFLHYIMSFILTVTQMITEGVDSGTEIIVQVTDSEQGDFMFKTDLTGLCRLQVQYEDLGARMIYLIFYIALVVYTVMFTWTYVKRAITMAFLTLMAPLVAITYPIDKISDGKAQAFGIWLKEFIFNALLQPFHLIIYTIFLGAASEIATKNPIYAILFLAFIIPSEKLLRKMFGFDKTSTAGAMNTAASMLGGAAVFKTVSSLLNKGASGAKSGKGTPRTRKPLEDSNAPKLADAVGGNNPNVGVDTAGGFNPEASSEPREAQNNLTDEETEEMNALRGELDNTDYNDMYLNPDAYQEKERRLAELEAKRAQQQQSQQTRMRTENLQRDHINVNDDTNASDNTIPQGAPVVNRIPTARMSVDDKENDNRLMSEWIGDKVRSTRFGRALTNGATAIRNLPGRMPDIIANQTPGIRNLPKPVRNSIRGAVGTIGRTAKGIGKFAVTAGVGATFGLAAGIAGDDLEDVLTYGAAGAALGATGLPALGRGLSARASAAKRAFETDAVGSEAATLRQQAREKMQDEDYRGEMDELYKDMYKKEPTASESREFAKESTEYYNSGITETKDIKKSMKLQKQIKEQMVARGIEEESAHEQAKKQAMVISKIASETKKEDLINEGKSNDIRNNMIKELMAANMDKKTAEANADYTLNLVKQLKGVY